MSGRPAETWRKFTFSTAPAWTYALLVLVCLGLVGIIVFAIVLSAVSIKAAGHLPLTRSSRRTADLVIWAPASLILGSFALMTAVVVAAFSNVDAGDPNAGTVGGLIFLVGIFVLVAGLVGRLLVGPLVLPRGKVEQLPGYYDRVVELRHVHPVFVAAVLQRQQALQVQQPDTPLSS
jgi:uncharacterized membrane protein